MSGPERSAPGGTDRSVRAVLGANTGFYQAIESGDLTLMSAVWADSDDVVCVHPGTAAVRGRGAVLRSWAVVMASLSYIQFFLTDTSVALYHDVAVVSCTENVLTGLDAQGGEPPGFAGAQAVATNVFLLTTGGWRLVAHHSSPVLGDEQGEEGEAAGEPEDGPS